jgi:polysaccharide pyruvyl transferase WcaK-like protein
MHTARQKISLFGHFGTQNMGNEATLAAILSRLQALYPSREICCICSHPEVVAATYGIEAIPITRRSARIWDRQARFDKRLGMLFVGLAEAFRGCVRAYLSLKGTDLFIVPGTGLLTDAYGLSAWGPFGLFQWGLAARLRGCSLMFVSVGAGPIRSALGRFFVRSTLSSADYRSYRDASSRSFLQDIGFPADRDRIYPDLVFSLPPDPTPDAGDCIKPRPVVAVGLMEYSGTYSAPDPRDDTYPVYLATLGNFVRWLLDNDYDVELLLGDGDIPVIEEFTASLWNGLAPDDEERVTFTPAASPSDLLSQIEAADYVVATRFHNILFSALHNKPVIAITFHHKCTSLMSQLGVSEFCHDIHDMSTERLVEQFQQLVRNADHVQWTLGERVDEFRAALDEQYDLVFEGSSVARARYASTVAA